MSDALLYREIALSLSKRAEGEDDNILRFTASSEAPVMRYGDSEILLHGDSNVRLERLRSLGAALVNHDPNQRGAAIIGADLAGGKLSVDVRFGLSDFARQVKQDVQDGLLRGVSVGYRVHTWEVDENARTYTATDWEPYEVSFTPIPADATVGVGRSADAWQTIRSIITPAANPAAATKEARVSEPENKAKPQGQDTAAPTNHDGSEAARAAAIAEAREITALAEDHGLRASEYLALGKSEATAKMLRDLAGKRATATPADPVVELRVDAVDKARDAAVGALMHAAGKRGADLKAIQEGNPLVGRSFQSIVKRYAAMAGERTENWEKEDVAYYALGKREMIRGGTRAANVNVGMFPNFVMLNAVTKIVAKGYEAGAPSARYRPLVSENIVPDFKQFSIGALGMGNLQKTLENIAFPELDKAEGVYNSTAKMWGGTLSLTIQAIVNDDTGEFFRNLGQAGVIADKTIDKRAFQKLLMGTSSDEATSTWTSNTTASCSPVWTTADTLAAARAKVNAGFVALMNKTGLDGNPLGTMPQFFIAGPTAGAYIQGLLQGVPGQTVGNGYAGGQQLIVSPWLESANLTGYSTTTFYIGASPNETTGLVLSKVAGFDSVQVMPYDAGPTAALNWKLWLPFEVDLHYLTVGSTATVAAYQQCTT